MAHNYITVLESIREAAKKNLFLVARPLRPLAPPPLGLVAIGTFFPYIKKSSFFLSGTPVWPPPLLMAWPLRK